MPNHKTIAGRDRTVTALRPTDPDSLVRFADLLKLRSLSVATQEEYLRYVRKLGQRKGCDPATLDEAQVREHVLHLKETKHHSASTIRSAVAAFSVFYRLHLGKDWKLFDLVKAPSVLTLPAVLTREEVSRLFSVVREPRFRMALRLIYACGLRASEALNLEVSDIKRAGPHLHLHRTKGMKERLVPLPSWCYHELRDYWRTHRHPRWIFPSLGTGWRDADHSIQLQHATRPMGIGSLQHCLRFARSEARLPDTVHPHTLRHSYATHLLEEGVNIRLISAYLGHATLNQTVIYTHLTAVNEASARVALDRLRPA